MNKKDKEWHHDHSRTVDFFLLISLMIQVLLSHRSRAHSSCGAPVRQAQMIQLTSLSFPLSVSSGNIPIFSSRAPSPLHLLPSLFPLLRAGGLRRHHSPPGDNRHKGGLGGPGCGRLGCTATGERVEESRRFPPVLRRPHLLR